MGLPSGPLRLWTTLLPKLLGWAPSSLPGLVLCPAGVSSFGRLKISVLPD